MSVAFGVEVAGASVVDARVALGGVAHKPWRAREVEAALIGRPLNADTTASGAALLGRDVRPYRHNRFKVALAQRAVVRAVADAAGRA